MPQLSDELTNHDCEMVFDDDLLDDSAPTRVSVDPRRELSRMGGREPRAEQVRAGDLLAGKYRVERVHRRGALGLTFEALHTQLGQRVAVRLLSADPQVHPEAVARFLRGARLAVQYQNEHTARVIDVGSLPSGSPFMVTELLAGSDLQRVLRVRDFLPVVEAVDYILQASEGLAEAHAHQVVHRNLKPTNLFLTRREGVRRVAVLDFGVSDDPLSDIAINLGSTHGAAKALAYLAPEQIREPATVDARADIWALGAILHEMLTGAMLHEAHATPALLAMIAADPALPVTHLRPEIAIELEAVVLRAVAKDREARYSNVAELAEALQPFASEEGAESVARIVKALGRRVTASSPPPLPGAMRPTPRTRAIVHVARPPKAPVAAVTSPLPRRWVELALTGAGLAAAGALGVFVAVHTMEGALAAALAPRAVVADLSPALPAPLPSAMPAPMASVAGTASAAPRAVAQLAPTAVAPAAAAPLAALPAARVVAPVAAPAPVAHPAQAKLAAAERAVVADAKPIVNAPANVPGLFDDAN